MATIDVKCWECGKITKVNAAHAGKKGKCPVCGKVITVPDPNKKPENLFQINEDVAGDELKKVAQAIANGPGIREKKKKGFFSKIFGR